MRRFALALLAALGLAGAGVAAPLDDAASDYVKLVLAVGELEAGYVDAYYGPPEWAAAAKAAKRPVADLKRDAAALERRIAAAAPGRDPLAAKRKRFLAAQLRAVAARLDFIAGKRLPFVEEAALLFGVRPELKPLASFDPVLARIERLVPGDGPLAARVEAFRKRFVVPKDRIEPVMRAATAECRARTLKHIALPPRERFTLELVTDKPWSGYNWYKGDATSLIQVNTDLPFMIQRAIDLGCHEGYPGHHVYNLLLERDLSKARGWVEFSVYPLYSPQSLIAEGSANYGIDLAFPGDEARAFEAKTLFPLAGLDPKDAATGEALRKESDALAGAAYTIAADYLAGRLTRAAAVPLIEKYQLYSRAQAEQRLRFIDTYRSYVINYGLGRDMVRAHVEAGGPAQRWPRMKALLSEPTVPGDLEGR